MSVELSLDNGTRHVFAQGEIIIGCAANCNFIVPPIDGIHDQHAVIRRIANRWLIESCGPWTLTLGQTATDTRHWIHPGDQIDLALRGPTLHFRAAPPQLLAADRDAYLQRQPQPTVPHSPPPRERQNRPQRPSESPAPQPPLLNWAFQPDGSATQTLPENSQSESTSIPVDTADATSDFNLPGPTTPGPRTTTRRRRRSPGIGGVMAEMLKTVLGALVGIVCAYVVMCHFLPNSALLKAIAPQLPPNLQPEMIRGDEIPASPKGDPTD
ncbi:hypothetical protein Poly24_45300 [Rosistilla carotiformis]|uniref:FHA domain-containing protein n=1 Tax=Rosistilla carotiformis TaxID=2528017 RepID=A0A518JZ28_9BACT|nr:FHA domain-containing protein [Rosistilla carotiformis]QDV70798.1 hypothetical protein Poly24_45300 [Rosistilla carotiformis]